MSIKKILPLILLTLCLTGCAAREEINDLALVMAVGIDKVEANQVLITAQIARPGDVRGDKGAGGGTGEPIWTATGEGETIFEAIRNLARFASRRVYWGHNMIIVVNEAVAREGIVDIIDFFSRNNELRMRTWIVVTEESAKDLVSVKTGLEVIPGKSIDNLFRYSPIVAEAPNSDMMSLSRAYIGEYTHPYLAMVHIGEKGVDLDKIKEHGMTSQVELFGIAVFRDDQMVGKLGPRESRGMLWFVEEVGSAIVPVSCPGGDGKTSIELRHNSFDITPQYKNGNIRFEVVINSNADLVELGCPTPMQQSEVMRKLEKDVGNYIKNDIKAMLQKIQKDYKVDVIRLGRTFQGRYPEQWNVIKEEWDELFPDVDIDIQVNVHLTDPQLLENPTRPNKDG